jgi:hypothetical protein
VPQTDDAHPEVSPDSSRYHVDELDV